MQKQLEFITYGAEVKRYHTFTTLQTDTVGHHSHGVALLCLMIEPNASPALLKAALLHDLAEQHTGDIPSPSKRTYGIGAQVEALEAKLLESAGFPLPELTPREERILKLADIGHGALFCLREVQLGNRRAEGIFDRYLSYLDGMFLIDREVDLFQTLRTMREKI
jgi:5'-deoxynucleotidase YfbR-like HD superfamily hydrolase